MEIINIIENDDGSADVEMELTEEEQRFLLNYAVNNILRKRSY